MGTVAGKVLLTFLEEIQNITKQRVWGGSQRGSRLTKVTQFMIPLVKRNIIRLLR